MGDVPCGCDMLAAAASEPSAEERARLEAEGPDYQTRWRCPRAGYPLPDDQTEPPAECAETLACVGRVTGFRDARTCPLFYARLPHVGRVVRARNWREHGCLRDVEPVTGPLVAALDVLDAAVAERHEADASHRAQDAERQRAALTRAHARED